MKTRLLYLSNSLGANRTGKYLYKVAYTVVWNSAKDKILIFVKNEWNDKSNEEKF